MNDNTDSSNSTTPPHAMIENGNKAFAWYVISAVVLIIDQITKIYFYKTLATEGNTISVIEPVLNWTLAYNHGAAFSFLADQGGWQKYFFSGLALLVSLFLVWYIRKIPKQATLLSLALALTLGGAIGNFIDRVSYGYVIDFIHVHYQNVWHYPVFNIADIGIVTGVVFMIYDMLFLEKKRLATAS